MSADRPGGPDAKVRRSTHRWGGLPVSIVDAARTPIGRLRGALSDVRPDDLAANLITALLGRNPALPAAAVDEVYLGAANQAGDDNRNVARMAVLLAGMPVTVPGATVNRLCGSGMEAILSAGRSIAVGDTEIAIAGGVESMSRAPFVIGRPTEGLPQHLRLEDSRLGWRFVNPAMRAEWTVSLGETAEQVAEIYEISRPEQDAFALRSHQRAIQAIAAHSFARELIPIDTPAGVVAVDEAPRANTSLEALAALPPAFRPGGTVTAGNSSPLNDGAAGLLLAGSSGLDRYGLAPIAEILGAATVGVEPNLMGIGPVGATLRLLARLNLTVADIAAFEINEAFASQALATQRQLGLRDDDPRVNALGGAIALGHPLGCSGARIVATLLNRLRESGGGIGIATMCIGVGQGIALAIAVS